MPPGFTASLATRLDGLLHADGPRGRRPARRSTRGTLLLAPGGAHLRLGDDRRIAALRRRPDGRPAPARRPHDRRRRQASTARAAAGRADRHGQGRPRRRQAPSRRAGGRILVEAESTCTVYGMPRAVAEAGLADEILAARRAARRDRPGGAREPRPPATPLRRRARAPPRPLPPPRRRSRRRSTATTSSPSASSSARSAASTCCQYKRGQMERRVRTWTERRGTPDLADLRRAPAHGRRRSSTPSWTA